MEYLSRWCSRILCAPEVVLGLSIDFAFWFLKTGPHQQRQLLQQPRRASRGSITWFPVVSQNSTTNHTENLYLTQWETWTQTLSPHRTNRRVHGRWLRLGIEHLFRRDFVSCVSPARWGPPPKIKWKLYDYGRRGVISWPRVKTKTISSCEEFFTKQPSRGSEKLGE